MPALKQVQTDSDYHKQTALNDIKKLNSQLKELPGFCTVMCRKNARNLPHRQRRQWIILIII